MCEDTPALVILRWVGSGALQPQLRDSGGSRKLAAKRKKLCKLQGPSDKAAIGLIVIEKVWLRNRYLTLDMH